MSIAVTAPQKFAFQDLVCIEAMLRFYAHGDATLLVEPDGGEDAELAFSEGERQVRYEIQVKGAGGTVALDDIAACLAHAPPRSVGPTLLERLMADPDRFALLVMSGRADDASAAYLGGSAWQGGPHAASRISAANTSALLSRFEKADIAGSDGSKLKARRQAHNAAFAASADQTAVRETLARVVVLDQVDHGLEAACAELLRRGHAVPGDRTAPVLLELRAAVGEAKSGRTDAFPLLRRILARASPEPIRPGDYVERRDEAGLVAALSREDVLLLSGTPRVGKTYAARRIAAEFRQEGYDVQEFADVEPAERFLLGPGTAPRLVLLDDPLGGSQASSEATRALSRLSNLIGRTSPQRKLLVAQGLEPLLATTRTPSLDETLTANRRWRDMGDLEPDFLVRLWRSVASASAVEGALRERVADALASSALVLEPGCLQHLAANTDRLGASSSIADVARLAREDAAQLGRTLAADGLEGLAIALAVATAPQEPIGLVHLAYVRGSGGAGLPSKRSELGTAVTIGGPPVPPPAAPAYDEPPELAADDRSGLDALERKRLVTVDGQPAAGFAHPFYRAAAEALLDAPTYHATQAIADAVRRGLFCLSPQTSRAAARNLRSIYSRLGARPGARDLLIAEAIEGLHSLFPATRDLCFQFLLSCRPDLPIKQQQELPHWIACVTSVTLHNLEWSNGEAHLPYGREIGTDYFYNAFRTTRGLNAAEFALLDAPEGLVSPERASAALGFLAATPEAMTPTMARRLLSYDEAALRAEAGKLWLSRPRTGDQEILDRIFADDHPSCALAALQGVVRGWQASSPDRRSRHLDGLATLAGGVAAAAAMLDFLVLFDRVEHTGEQPPWPIFERLMPVVMAALPPNAAFIDARLFAVALSALDALTPPSIVALCDSWIEWLERNERAGTLPSEFSLGVAKILLGGTAAEPERRSGRVARLLAFTGTGAKVAFIADLIDDWELLLDGERTAVLACIASGRSDDRWLQAVALTRSQVPDDVVGKLLPDGTNLTQLPGRLMVAMSGALVDAAIHVYAGQPQPLWWLGTHHSGRATWEPVMEAVARLPEHALFELAWDHIASAQDGGRMARIVTDLGAAGAQRALDILLPLKVRWNGNFMPEAWAAVLRLAACPDEHGRWLDRMAEASPAVLDDISEVPSWLTEDNDVRGMLDRLKADVLLLEVAGIAFDQRNGDGSRDMQCQAAELLALVVRERPPMLFGTCDRLIRTLERASIDSTELITALHDRRARIFKERQAIKMGAERPDPPLDGWIAP